MRRIGKHIRERDLSEEALRESNERFQNAFEHAAIGMALVATDGHWLRVNRALCDLIGYSESELLAKTFQDITHPDDLDADLGYVLQTLAGEIRTYQMEKRYFHKDGHMVWILLSVSLVRDAEGNPVHFISQIQDITERKWAKDAVKASEERFRLLFDNAGDGILLADLEDKIFKMGNRKICEMLGYSQEEIQHLGVMDIHPEEDLPYVIDAFEKQARGELIVVSDIPVRRRDGSVFYAEISTAPVTLGDRCYLMGRFRDVTRERELQKRAQTAQRMESVGTLAGGIAHDFNNALTGILGYSELLRMRIAGDPKSLSDLDEISRAAERAATLTRQLLTFARRQVVEPVNLDVSDVAKDLVRFFAKLAGAQIEVKTFLAADSPTVWADRGQIEQVLMNLCLNARDAMPQGGQLIVETGGVTLREEHVQRYPYMKAGHYALLLVSDTGIGMDEATRDRIFEPFFTTKAPDKGTGLGLSVLYGIVKQHNGYIHVYSEPGKGSTFKVYLPAVDAKPDVRMPASKEAVQGGSETILLAEDEEAIRGLAERVLTDYGYSVLAAKNGEEAFELFRRNQGKIALALLDVVMPRMGGKEAYEEMRKQSPNLKVIFMSGYSANAVHEGFVIKPGTPFLGKPFVFTVLLRKVREVLDNA
jgi:PAS domain S-box-containing protein